MPELDLNKLIEWANQKSSRTVSIHINDKPNTKEIRIWAYDYEFRLGQHVNSVEEIDLEGLKRREDLTALEALKAKYEQPEQPELPEQPTADDEAFEVAKQINEANVPEKPVMAKSA